MFMNNKHLINAPIAYARHKIIIDANNNPVDYIFLEVNKAFEKMTGLKAEDITNKRVTEVLPKIKSSKFNWVKEYGKIAINQSEKIFEQYSEPLNKWYRVNVYSTEKYYFSTFFIEITPEKERTEELEIFFNVTLDLFAISDLNGSIIKVNTQWEKLFGYTLKEIESKNILYFIHENDREKTKLLIDNIIHNEDTIDNTNRVMCKDGRMKYIEWRFKKYNDLIYISGRDVTSNIKTKQELEKMLDNVNEAMFLIEIIEKNVFKVVRINRKYMKLTNITLEEIKGKTPEEILGKQKGKEITNNYKKCIKFDKTISYEEKLSFFSKDQYWLTTLNPIYEKGEIKYIVGTTYEITERKILEIKIKEENKLYENYFDKHDTGTFNIIINKEKKSLENKIESLKINKINKTFAVQYGVDEKKIIGKSPLKLFGWKKEEFLNFINTLIKDGKYSHILNQKKKDGTIMKTQNNYICIYDEYNNAKEIFGTQIELE